jgi:hypothetical protein
MLVLQEYWYFPIVKSHEQSHRMRMELFWRAPRRFGFVQTLNVGFQNLLKLRLVVDNTIGVKLRKNQT